ncbi:MAG: hypothetical protein FWG34_09200 [Oscillospiraceae bacterium]|nr:hypothetical protein [Oscillospiraceae bacterium]
MRYRNRRTGNIRGRSSHRRSAGSFGRPHRHHHRRRYGRFPLGCLIPVLIALAAILTIIIIAT